MKKLILAIGAAAACGAVGLAAELRTPVVIAGCVHAGDAADTYVLTSVDDLTDGKRVPSGPVYWLSTTKELKDHVGQKVEVRGTYSLDRDFGKTAKVIVKTDPAKGEQTVALENGDKKAEIKEDLKPVGTSGVAVKSEEKRIYRRLDVTAVKTIAARCDVP